MAQLNAAEYILLPVLLDAVRVIEVIDDPSETTLYYDTVHIRYHDQAKHRIHKLPCNKLKGHGTCFAND